MAVKKKLKKCKCEKGYVVKITPVGFGQTEREKCSNPECAFNSPSQNKGW